MPYTEAQARIRAQDLHDDIRDSYETAELLGSPGTMLPGGYSVYTAYREAHSANSLLWTLPDRTMLRLMVDSLLPAPGVVCRIHVPFDRGNITSLLGTRVFYFGSTPSWWFPRDHMNTWASANGCAYSPPDATKWPCNVIGQAKALPTPSAAVQAFTAQYTGLVNKILGDRDLAYVAPVKAAVEDRPGPACERCNRPNAIAAAGKWRCWWCDHIFS